MKKFRTEAEKEKIDRLQEKSTKKDSAPDILPKGSLLKLLVDALVSGLPY